MSVVEGIVLQKSKIERPRKSRERSFLDISTAAKPASGLTFPREDFWFIVAACVQQNLRDVFQARASAQTMIRLIRFYPS
jgi:hypothetical protein